MQNAYILGLFIATLSVLGPIFYTVVFKKISSDSHVSRIVPFASGVFLITSGLLLFESFEHGGFLLSIAFFAAGVSFFALLHSILPETHHHIEGESCHKKISPWKIIIGDGIHNITDGFVIAALVTSGQNALIILGVVSIALHEVVQEVAEFMLLKASGFKTRRALSINLLSGCSIFIGIFIGNLFEITETAQVALLAFAGGGLAHVVFYDLFPYDACVANTKKETLKRTLIFILGISISLLATQLLPHSHPEIEHVETTIEDENN